MNPTDHLVLSAQHHFADIHGIVTESVRVIGAHIGRSAPAVSSSLKRLVGNGHLVQLPKTSVRSVGRFKIVAETSIKNRGNGLTKTWPILTDAQGLPDVFRSPALRTAGVLHRAAHKGQETTVSELLELGVVRTPKTLRKTLEQLSDLPSPLASTRADPTHAQRQLWVINPLTDEAEVANVAYLNQLPGAEPKTRAMHERENAEHQRGYLEWFGGHQDVSIAYARDVAPFIEPDPNNLGCERWTGELNKAGYGMPYPGSPYLAAHRLSWLATVGYLATGDALHHWCGNRACTFVGHLMPMSPEQHRAIHASGTDAQMIDLYPRV